jgi:hypothetical protein
MRCATSQAADQGEAASVAPRFEKGPFRYGSRLDAAATVEYY